MFFFANHFEIEKGHPFLLREWDLLTPKAASLCGAPHSIRQVLAFATVKLSKMYVIGYGCFFPKPFWFEDHDNNTNRSTNSSHLSVTSKKSTNSSRFLTVGDLTDESLDPNCIWRKQKELTVDNTLVSHQIKLVTQNRHKLHYGYNVSTFLEVEQGCIY